MTTLDLKNEPQETIKDSSQQRHYWVDIAKSISIFGVVFIHSGGGDISFYFRFCVPIFISISFFLTKSTENKGGDAKFVLTDFYKKRLPRLMYPYLFWSLLYAVGQYYLGIKDSVDFSPIFGWQGQYFFVILIQLTLLYPLARLIKIRLNFLICIGIATLLLFIPFSYLNLDSPGPISGQAPFYYWLFYMFLGMQAAASPSEKFFGDFSKINQRARLVIFFALPIFIYLENKILLFFNIEAYPYLRISVLMVSALMFEIGRTFQFSLQTPKLFKSIVSLLSKWSLGIFCLNPIIIQSLHKTRDLIGGPNNQDLIIFILMNFLTAAISCLIAIFICRFIKKLGLSFLVL